MRYRRRLASFAAATAAALAVAPSPAHAGVSACGSSTASAVPTRSNMAQVERTVLCLVNRERSRRGLRGLRASGKLGRAAEAHSRDMVRRSYFDHVSPAGGTMTDRIKRTGWLRGAGGHGYAENIAWGSGQLASPKSIVRSWMDSSGHRRNILNGRYTELGVGVALGTPENHDGATYTTNFGFKG